MCLWLPKPVLEETSRPVLQPTNLEGGYGAPHRLPASNIAWREKQGAAGRMRTDTHWKSVVAVQNTSSQTVRLSACRVYKL